MHFRLRKTAAHNESWECDQPSVEMALLDFGHQLRSVLALEGDVVGFLMESRSHDAANFTNSAKVPVYVLK
jgi:hypothetical protein